MGQPQPVTPDLLTVADFLATSWPDAHRHQLIEGHVLAMAPPARAHASLVATLSHAIERVLTDDCCEVLTDVGLAPLTREHTCYEVDLLVTCEAAEPRQRLIRAPVLLVEVLSPSTAAIDRQHKLPDYRQLLSAREIALIDSERMLVELHRRYEGDHWSVEVLHAPTDVLHFECFDLDITLAQLYRRVALPPDARTPGRA